MRVRLWGVRGSLPAPMIPAVIETREREILELFIDSKYSKKAELSKFLDTLPVHTRGTFGGNTPCVSVESGNNQLIVDGGSGIRRLGYDLLRGPCGKGAGEVHILFTHFHWDHLIGVPFFVPVFIPGNVIHVYAVQDGVESVFRTLFKKPFFPVEYEMLGARFVYHKLEPRKPVKFGLLTVTPYQLDHPDPCWGFKFECGGKVFSHCVDTECTRVTRDQLGLDLPLYQGVDLMTFDAQYTLMETIEKMNWGHAAASLGLDIAMREGVKKVVFMHHDPASSDEKIAAAELQARQYYKGQLKNAKRAGLQAQEVDWCFGKEDMEFEL
ncbi:MAG: MBL fold metallo-hydrolase [Bdellovibrionales bacterium RIFOXYD1_FULL_53_11]|nr:MAG: MBL fold metallo-hydrolase [Bdellovibrionales bacterium RIFOXYD1_FULL_53_11]